MTIFVLRVICFDSDPRLSWKAASKISQKMTWCLLGVGAKRGNSWQIHLNDQKICLAGTFSAKCPLNRLTSCKWFSWTPKYKPETESNYCLAQRRDWEQWRLIYNGNVIQCWEPLNGWLSNCDCSVSCVSPVSIILPQWTNVGFLLTVRVLGIAGFSLRTSLCVNGTVRLPAWISVGL